MRLFECWRCEQPFHDQHDVEWHDCPKAHLTPTTTKLGAPMPTTTPVFEPVEDIPRDRWSRPLIIPPGGGKPTPYTRCTTFVDVLDDKYNLQLWQQRMVAAGLAARPDLLLRASSLKIISKTDHGYGQWKRDLNQVCADAREAAAASAAATTGTALHALTELIDKGQDVGPVPDGYQEHLRNYTEATRSLTPVLIEQFCVQDQYQVGGTPDRIVKVDGDPGLFVGDVKTGGIAFGAGKIAMQLAMYAHSQPYKASGQRGTLDGLNTDRGIIIALDAHTGQCDLHWIDLTKAWEAIKLAAQVREWRQYRPTDFLTTFGLSDTAATALEVAIGAATTVDELTQIWSDAGRHWTDQHTQLAAARKAVIMKQPTQ